MCLFLGFLPLWWGCPLAEEVNPWAGRTVEALVPQYEAQLADYSNISVEGPRAFENLGDILVVGNRILIVDFFTGVHIIDNTDPEDPINVAFVSIPGVHTITFDQGNLICNYGTELILINITNLEAVEVVSSIEGFFNQESRDHYPRNYQGPFQCVDASKGILAGWSLEEVDHPRCWL